MQIIKFLCKTSSNILLKFTKIIEYLEKLAFFISHTIVIFQLKITGISHISYILCIPYCFSTSCIISLPNLQVSK